MIIFSFFFTKAYIWHSLYFLVEQPKIFKTVHYHDQIGLPKNAEAPRTLWVSLPPHVKIEVLVFLPN